jgi:hypothetical protein
MLADIVAVGSFLRRTVSSQIQQRPSRELVGVIADVPAVSAFQLRNRRVVVRRQATGRYAGKQWRAMLECRGA